MRFFTSFLNFFTAITTAITAVVGAIALIDGSAQFSGHIALQILGSGALTALLSAAIFGMEFRGRKHFAAIMALHYILLCIVMNILGIMFGWINATPVGIVVMCVYVAAVYLAVYGISYVKAKNDADEINRALGEKKGR